MLWWVQWASGGDEEELRSIASVGDDVARLVRAARFEATPTTWHQARLAMNRVVDLGQSYPSSEALLRAASSRVLAVPGIPPPPRHAYAAPNSKLPPEGESQ